LIKTLRMASQLVTAKEFFEKYCEAQ